MSNDMTFVSKRPTLTKRCFTSKAVEEVILDLKKKITDPEIAWLFENCYPNTLDTTVKVAGSVKRPDTFVITGDIPSMWLRDSTAQVWPYLPLVGKDDALQNLVLGVINRQVDCVLLDPYANAFEHDPATLSKWAEDRTEMKPGIHERKFELDSLCAVLRLCTGYYQASGDKSFVDAPWEQAVDLIMATMERERHMPSEGEKPHYHFQRKGYVAHDTMPMGGRGNPGKNCGLIRSPFRPSDDSTMLPFLIPSNAMAVMELRRLAEFCFTTPGQEDRGRKAAVLAEEVNEAILKYGIVNHPECGKIFAYEVDGYGSFYFMDDANVPSLISLPYLGYCTVDDEVYAATRKALLSRNNPYYSEGKAAFGVGGPHTGQGNLWPMAIILRALTSESETEVRECLETLKKTHAGTGFMHESFWMDDASRFTRPWFAWANTLFGELILHISRRWPTLL